MNKRIPFQPPDAPQPAGPYSQAIRSGGLLFLAGQGPFRPDGSKVEGAFDEQARQTFRNLEAVAAAPGASLARAVRGGGDLRDLANFSALHSVFLAFFPTPPPPRTPIPSTPPSSLTH